MLCVPRGNGRVKGATAGEARAWPARDDDILSVSAKSLGESSRPGKTGVQGASGRLWKNRLEDELGAALVHPTAAG